MSDPRRRIPAVDALLQTPEFDDLTEAFGRARVVEAARLAVDAVRDRVARGEEPDDVGGAPTYASIARGWLESGDVPSLRTVINATGVVLHTNLGRAPLPLAATEAMAAAARSYSNLEYDIGEGRRGSRYDHCVDLLRELTGAQDALVVNNNAAALVLALNTVARGQGVAVSRGELVEIGGGFRIPDILERSGARLVEVGSTNRTRLDDYSDAITEQGATAILKVHRSNFRMTGFTEEASLEELASLAAEHGVPLVHDLGSGLFIAAERLGLPTEPRAVDSLAAGVGLVAVSGDKLLGGPQAGIVLGSAEHIGALRANPLCRALRVDKVTLAGLEGTLRLYRDEERALREIPTLRMLSASDAVLSERATALVEALVDLGVEATLAAGEGAVGGGTYPGVALEGPVVRVLPGEGNANELAARMRRSRPPVVARVVDDAVVIDPRTVLPDEDADLVRVVSEAV